MTGAALSKRPKAAQRQLHPRSSPLLSPQNVDSTSAQTGFEVCFAEGVPCNAHRTSLRVLLTERPRTLPLNLLPSHRDLLCWLDDASVGDTKREIKGLTLSKKRQISQQIKEINKYKEATF